MLASDYAVDELIIPLFAQINSGSALTMDLERHGDDVPAPWFGPRLRCERCERCGHLEADGCNCGISAGSAVTR